MKKKNFLISGLFVLGAVAGVASWAVTQSLPQYAAEAEGEGEEEVTPTYNLTVSTTSEITMVNKTFLTSDNLSVLTIPTNDNSDDGLDVVRQDAQITVTKDGAAYASISVNSTADVYIGDRYKNTLYVKLPAAITEPGKYEVSVPAGVVECVGFGEDGKFINLNKAFTFSFTVKKGFDYTVAPANGDILIPDLNTVTVTYPEGATVQVGSAPVATLMKFLNGQYTEAGTYNVTASGNVVTLNYAGELPKLENYNATNYYYFVEVKENSWTTTLDGESLAVTTMNVGNWHPIAFMIDGFKPNFKTGEGTSANASSFGTFKIQYPETFTVDASKIPTLKCNDGGARTIMQYNNPTFNATGKVVTYTAQAANSGTTCPNDLSYIINGTYYMEIPAKTYFVGSETYGSILKYEPINIVNGADHTKIWGSTCTPKANSANASCQTITLKYLYKMKVNNPDAEIKLYKDGVLVKSMKASETTTSAAAADKAGSQTIAYKFYASTNKESGEYTVEIPEGAFVSVFNSEVTNLAESYKFYINPKNPAFTTNPTSYNTADMENTCIDELQDIEIIYPEDCTVEMNPSAVNVVGNTAIATGTPTYSPSGSNLQAGVKISSVRSEGNKIIVSLNKPCYQTTNDKYCITLSIPASAFLITQDGVTLPNNLILARFRMNKVKAPEVLVGGNAYEGAALSLANITGTSITKTPTPIVLSFYMSCYGFNTTTNPSWTGSAYLGDAEGNKIVAGTTTDTEGNEVEEYITFNGATPDGVQTNFGLFLTSAMAEKVNLKEGEIKDFTIVIPKDNFGFGTASATAGARVNNTEDIILKITLGKPGNIENFVQPATPANPEEFYRNQSYASLGMNYVLWNLANNTISVDKECGNTIKLYYTAPESEERTLVCELDPAKEGQIDFPSIGGAAEDEPIEFTGQHQVILNFDAAMAGYAGSDDDTSGASGKGNAELMKTGKYDIEVPDGLFTMSGLPMNGFTSTYNYIDEDNIDTSYVITPTPNSELPEKVESISIEFPNVETVYLVSMYGAKLYDEKNVQFKGKKNYPTIVGNKATWVFDNANNVWAPGTHTFKINANMFNVGLPQYDSNGYENRNWPEEAMNITYIVTDKSVGVTLIGIEGADSYNVYTLDGKVLMINAAPEKLVELENGAYIVNGKKVIIRK